MATSESYRDKVTRFHCASEGCEQHKDLTDADPLPRDWCITRRQSGVVYWCPKHRDSARNGLAGV